MVFIRRLMFPQCSNSLGMRAYNVPHYRSKQMKCLSCAESKTFPQLGNIWQFPYFLLAFLSPSLAADHLAARSVRPAPAVPLADGQPWHQHRDPAGPSLPSVQLRHHSGSIHQQTDRVSRLGPKNTVKWQSFVFVFIKLVREKEGKFVFCGFLFLNLWQSGRGTALTADRLLIICGVWGCILSLQVHPCKIDSLRFDPFVSMRNVIPP